MILISRPLIQIPMIPIIPIPTPMINPNDSNHYDGNLDPNPNPDDDPDPADLNPDPEYPNPNPDGQIPMIPIMMIPVLILIP